MGKGRRCQTIIREMHANLSSCLINILQKNFTTIHNIHYFPMKNNLVLYTTHSEKNNVILEINTVLLIVYQELLKHCI